MSQMPLADLNRFVCDLQICIVVITVETCETILLHFVALSHVDYHAALKEDNV